MTNDCGCCGQSFQAEGDETTCVGCEDCQESCETQPEMVVITPQPISNTHNGGDCYSFSQLEELLFLGQDGQKTLARILTRMRVEGYDEEAWKVIIGLTAYAYKHYNCKGLPVSEQLKMLENAPLREITHYMIGNLEQLTQQVMNAESLKPSMEKNSEREDKDAFKIIALGLTALAFAYATRG